MTETIMQYVLCFYIYCFLGWCIESTIVSIEQKMFVNRGFLRLPMLPLYGSGSMVILIITLPVRDGNPFWIYLFGMIGATILEYITAVLMEGIFKTKYWDYSNEKYNFQGRICVKASLFWGCLSLFLVYVVNPPIQSLADKIPFIPLVIVDSVISAVFIADTIVSFKAAFDINKVLAVMTSIMEEAATVREKIEERMAERTEKVEERKAERAEKVDVELDKLKYRLEELKEQATLNVAKLSLAAKDMIKSNPTSSSKKFNDALADFKRRIIKK